MKPMTGRKTELRPSERTHLPLGALAVGADEGDVDLVARLLQTLQNFAVAKLHETH